MYFIYLFIILCELMVATDKHIVFCDTVTILAYVVPSEWITSEWWMETGVKGSTLGRSPDPLFLLEELRKTHSNHSFSPGWDLNLEPPNYASRLIPCWPQPSFIQLFILVGSMRWKIIFIFTTMFVDWLKVWRYKFARIWHCVC